MQLGTFSLCGSEKNNPGSFFSAYGNVQQKVKHKSSILQHSTHSLFTFHRYTPLSVWRLAGRLVVREPGSAKGELIDEDAKTSFLNVLILFES